MNAPIDVARLAASWGTEEQRLETLGELAGGLSDSDRYEAARVVLEQALNSRPSRPPPSAPTASQLRRQFFAACDEGGESPLEPDGVLEELAGELRIEAARHPSLGWLAASADEMLKPIDHEAPLRVAVFGVFSAGKSSLLNSLLGIDLLSTALVPVTCSLTRIEWGDEESVTVTFEGGDQRTVGHDELSRWTDQSEARDGDAVEEVVLHLPNPLLRQITFLDTPGLNSGDKRHDLAAERVVAEADVVLWVFNATKPGSELERRELRHVERSAGKAVGVLSQIDKIRPRRSAKPARWQRELREVEEVLTMHLGGRITQWVQASAVWMKEGAADSGRGAFETLFADFRDKKMQLQRDGRRRRLREAARQARTLRELRDSERAQRTALSMDHRAEVSSFVRQAAKDWREELALARRKGCRFRVEPELADAVTRDSLLRLCPALDGGLSTEADGLWSDSGLGGLLPALVALESLADVLRSTPEVAVVWEQILGKAAELGGAPPRLPWVWLADPPARASGPSLLDRLLENGDAALMRAATQSGGGPSRHRDLSGLWRKMPRTCAAPEVEHALPRLGPALHAEWRARCASLLGVPGPTAGLAPDERRAAALGLLNPEGGSAHPETQRDLRKIAGASTEATPVEVVVDCGCGRLESRPAGGVLVPTSDGDASHGSPARAAALVRDTAEGLLGVLYVATGTSAGLGAIRFISEPVGRYVYLPVFVFSLGGLMPLLIRQRRRVRDAARCRSVRLFEEVRKLGFDRALLRARGSARRRRWSQQVAGLAALATAVAIGDRLGSERTLAWMASALTHAHEDVEGLRLRAWDAIGTLPGAQALVESPLGSDSRLFVHATGLAVRAGPSPDARRLRVLAINTPVTRTAGGGVDGWIRVRTDSAEVPGWVSAQFLGPDLLTLGDARARAAEAAAGGDREGKEMWLRRAGALEALSLDTGTLGR